jgi:hypothetical protein
MQKFCGRLSFNKGNKWSHWRHLAGKASLRGVPQKV